MVLSEQEKKAFATLAQSRNGEIVLGALVRHKDEIVTAWLANLDPNHGAHMRGKASVFNELISLIRSLSQSKE